MIITTIIVGELQTNCYLVASDKTKEAMIVDPGTEPSKIIDVIEKSGLKPLFIVNTHIHPDHVEGNIDVSKKFQIPCYIGEKDFEMLEVWKVGLSRMSSVNPDELKFSKTLKEDDELLLGDLKFKVLETPGHSPGSICLYGHGVLFSGDTLFAGDVGRVNIFGGSEEKLIKSFKRLLELPEETKVYPGHDRVTTIKEERKSNILVKELGLR